MLTLTDETIDFVPGMKAGNLSCLRIAHHDQPRIEKAVLMKSGKGIQIVKHYFTHASGIRGLSQFLDPIIDLLS